MQGGDLYFSQGSSCSQSRCYSPVCSWSESAPRDWNQYFSPLLAQGLALCHGDRPQWDTKCPTSRGAGAGTRICRWWLLDLTPQSANRPRSLPAGSPSPPANPYTIPMVSGRWKQKVTAWLHLRAQLSKSCLSKLFLAPAQVVSPPPPPFPCTLLFEGWALAGTHWHRLTARVFHVLVCPSGMWGWWEGSCSLLPSQACGSVELAGLPLGLW